MRLATPEAVLQAAGIQSGPGTLASAGVALDVTLPIMEAALETILRQTTRVDRFDLGSDEVKNPTVRLAQGFVSADDTITVTANGVVLEASAYSVNYELGTVRLYGTYVAGIRAIEVAYTAGFAANTSDNTQFDGLPDALTQAGIAKASAYMLLNPAHSPKEKARFLGSVSVDGLELRVRQAIATYTRPRATVIWPESTEVET